MILKYLLFIALLFCFSCDAMVESYIITREWIEWSNQSLEYNIKYGNKKYTDDDFKVTSRPSSQPEQHGK